MKIDKRSWIPLIGLYYAWNAGGWIFLYDEYMKYQTMCFALTVFILIFKTIF